jgi:hypothetical protein
VNTSRVAGGISGGAKFLHALRVNKPADSGALEPETTALRRRHWRRQSQSAGAMETEKEKLIAKLHVGRQCSGLRSWLQARS